MSSPTTNMFPGVALVTGAASGIGQATAVSFAKEGCSQIVIADRNVNGLNETHSRVQEAAPSCSVLSVQTDVSDQESVQALIDKAVETFGRLDYVCNSAGTLSNNERSHETSLEEFDRINNINYKGCWLCSRAEIQQILKQEPLPTHDGRPGNRGSVVNIASQLGIYSNDNIRVNCICPGVIETPMTTPNMDVLGPAISIAPMNRPGTAQEVADCVLFLCSSKATFVQGSAMVVDGGYVIN
ncbi:NAD(P)-binding protein [Hortaea werneckii]|nr:NAD(P)-binding protein [Hortaea werneckii]